MNNELQELLSLDIPSANRIPDGFLEIAGIAHYENINSRIYAHFLNSEHDGVRSSFVNALLQLVNDKSRKRHVIRFLYHIIRDYYGQKKAY